MNGRFSRIACWVLAASRLDISPTAEIRSNTKKKVFVSLLSLSNYWGKHVVSVLKHAMTTLLI